MDFVGLAGLTRAEKCLAELNRPPSPSRLWNKPGIFAPTEVFGVAMAARSFVFSRKVVF